MRKALKWFFLILLGSCILLEVFVWIYAPIPDKNLAEKYTRFRADFQPTHDAIDARFNHRDRFVKGIQCHYVDQGSPERRVILFLHGLPEGWYSWRYVLTQIDPGYRLIAIDMKGYGRSDLKDTDYNWHHVADQIMDLMDSLQIRNFFVVSHDWGSIIGSILVSDHPQRILGFVRMEADLVPKTSRERLVTYRQKPQWLLFRSNGIATYLIQDPGRFIDRVYQSRLVTPFNPVDRNYLVYEFSRPGVAEMNPKYFNPKNWDLDTAIGKICKNNFPLSGIAIASRPRSCSTQVPVRGYFHKMSECPLGMGQQCQPFR